MKIVHVPLLVIGLTLAIISPSRADDPDPMQILEKADAAVKKIKAISYFGEMEPMGWLVKRMPAIKGKVRAARLPDDSKQTDGDGIPPVRITGILKPPRSFDENPLDISTNGKCVTIIDKEAKTYMVGDMKDGAEFLDQVKPIFLSQLLKADGFHDEMASKSVSYKGEDTIAKVKCEAVQVVYSDKQETIWWFGKKDHLPRRAEIIYRDATAGDARLIVTAKKLEIDPEIKKGTFKPKPKGYTLREIFPPSSPDLLATGTKAPLWSLKTPGGKNVALKSLRGNVVVLDFWATWCGPCKAAMPGVQKLHEKYQGKQVKIFGVNTWERDGDPVDYMKSKSYTYGLLLNGNDVAQKYKLSGIPAFYVIDQQGEIIFAMSGYSPQGEEMLSSIIDKLLKRTQTASDGDEETSKKKTSDEKGKKKTTKAA